MRAIAVIGLCFAALLPAGASAAPRYDWVFRTPGDDVYCAFENGFSALRCVRPSNGFWIRVTPLSPHARITKGHADEFRGFRRTSVAELPFGREFLSSDAALISCRSLRSGLTCKEYNGLSFWLGRRAGFRIYFDGAGFRPSVRPFFRTGHGVWCGLNRATLEPAAPQVVCWRPDDGLQLTLSHRVGTPADYEQRNKARGYRPAGFRLLGNGGMFTWRCRKVDREFAERCSTSSGDPVFTCTSERARLTCRNRGRHGFWVNARSFYGD